MGPAQGTVTQRNPRLASRLPGVYPWRAHPASASPSDENPPPRSTRYSPVLGPGGFAVGERCFHQKFGMGSVRAAEGDKLTIDFDKAGQKKVIAAFVQKP